MPKFNTTRMKIRRALLQGRLKWSQLLELRNQQISPGALSSNLKVLMKNGDVETEVDGTTRPATTYYKFSRKGRRQLKFWVDAWDEEMQETCEFLEIILKLTLQQKQKLRDLLERYIKLEEFEKIERDREYEIVDEEDKIVLRNRKTGKTRDFILFRK